MPTIVGGHFITSPHLNDDGSWSSQVIPLEDNSAMAEFTWPGLPLGMTPPPGLHVPKHLALSKPKAPLVRRPARKFKPKGPRPQSINTVIETNEPQPSSSSSSSCNDGRWSLAFASSQPPVRTHGIYGDQLRLPSHRPSRYTFGYACEGERFAHLAEFPNYHSPPVAWYSAVELGTMGLERFYWTGPGRGLRFPSWKAPLPPSRGASRLTLGKSVVKGALANFRERFRGTAAESG